MYKTILQSVIYVNLSYQYKNKFLLFLFIYLNHMLLRQSFEKFSYNNRTIKRFPQHTKIYTYTQYKNKYKC